MVLGMSRRDTDRFRVVHHGRNGSKGRFEVQDAGAEKEEEVGCRFG